VWLLSTLSFTFKPLQGYLSRRRATMNVLYLLCSWFCLCFHGWVGFHGGSWLFYTHFLFFPIIRVGLFGLNSFGFAPPHLSLVQLFVSKMEVVCFLSGWLCLWIRLCAWPCRHCVWVMSDLYAGIVCTWICPCWRLVHSSFLTVTNSHSTFFFYSSFESVHEFSR
jgi:hypothetical protein